MASCLSFQNKTFVIVHFSLLLTNKVVACEITGDSWEKRQNGRAAGDGSKIREKPGEGRSVGSCTVHAVGEGRKYACTALWRLFLYNVAQRRMTKNHFMIKF